MAKCPMRSVSFATVVGVLLLTSQANSQKINFDKDWKFSLGHASDANKDFGFSKGSFSFLAKAGTNDGPIGLGFSDLSWRTVQLPHDWAVELPFDNTADMMHGFKPIGRQFPQNSVGWYRKWFEVPKSDDAKRIRITFDGIYRDAYVFINGHLLGRHESGYTGATFDLTDYVKVGQKNVIAVRVDASHFEGWFYEGAGIYRHAWLTKSEPVYLVEDGTSIQTHAEPQGSIAVSAEVANMSTRPEKRTLSVSLKDANGKVIKTGKGDEVTIPPGETVTLECRFDVGEVNRWSPESPYLYTVETSIGSDQSTKKVGFRTIEFHKDKGFILNGKPYRIQGTCNHQDHAGVGSAIPDRLQDWRIEQLKKFGCNFYRAAHNPPTPELLDACDRLGMMVLSEVRLFGSTGEALKQLESTVKRDRNHASVIFWSIGNEEWGTQNTDESARIATTMMRHVRKLDPTRLVTFGANNGGETNGINKVVDIRGFNYNLGGLDSYRKARPDQPIHGSEVGSTVTTRGIYATDPARGYVNAYDINKLEWSSTAEVWWKMTLERPWFMGGFVWTGFDYRGEPTPYSWPNINSHFGILDTCGFFKDQAYYYKAWWTQEPVLHILPHWNLSGKEGQSIDVWVYSNHDEVELFQDSKSLGKQKMTKGGHLEWKVTYQPGTLSAKGYRGGKVVQESKVETTGVATQITLETDHKEIRADGADIAVINIKALDAKGRWNPVASNLLDFEIEGGRIIGVGNGDPSCHEADVVLGSTQSLNLENWKFLPVKEAKPGILEVATTFDDSQWNVASLEQNQLATPGTAAVLRKTFEVKDPSMLNTLSVGPIDDEGWIYLNGTLIGTTHEWSASHKFSVAGKLVNGENKLAIIVANRGGQGGLTGEVQLSGPQIPGKLKRSLFNGLAQIIVQSSDKAGTIKVKATGQGLKDATITINAK